MVETRRQRLSREAHRLKRAWLLGAAWVGRPIRLRDAERDIPDYASWPPHKLEKHVRDLQTDCLTVCRRLFVDAEKARTNGVLSWMTDQFAHWQAAGGGLFALGVAWDVEKRFGSLRFR